MTNRKKPRIAASSFLNSAPLIWSFSRGARHADVNWVDAVPSKCADLLARGEAEFALVPIIEFQRIKGGHLVPDVCVGSREQVRSVVLVSHLNNLHKVKSVALDESSRTSATLVKICFKEFLGSEPRWTTAAPDLEKMLRQNDAALMIGDPAMLFARDRLHVWDLAELWRANTGFGFVFAMWMAREGIDDGPDFAAARAEGLSSIEEIVATYANQTALEPAEIREYLLRHIVFQMDNDLRRGMELYFKLAHDHGLIPQVKPLSFLGARRQGSISDGPD